MKQSKLKELYRSDIFSHLPQMNYLPRWGVLLLDLLLCAVAFWLSVWVGSGIFDYIVLAGQKVPIGVQFLIVMGIQVVAFWAFHTYSGIIRYSTFIDTIKLLLSTITTGLTLLVINTVMDYSAGYHPVLNTVIIVYVLLSFVMLFVLRVGVKTLAESMQRNSGSPRVMIYGTVLRSLRCSVRPKMHPIVR